ncbi:hypothetical protein GOV11_02555, partial [Candidatus Woesearchaeota archaeon]|nr:hypothetical protein [Candidatus Woesearchaeota archaeon]
MLGLLSAILAGIFSGIITGLTPGVHINLVAAILLSASVILSEYTSMLNIAVLIVSMSITHNFVDMIPAIFLGAPEESTVLGVLPGHRYLLQGNGLMAVKLSVWGGLVGTVLVVLTLPLMIWLIGFLAEVANRFVFWILLGFVLFSIWKDKKRALAVVIFILSGIVGFITLRLPMKEPLLPLLSGIFGIATLLYSIKENNTIPEQKNLPYTEMRKLWKGSILGTAGAFLTALFPGISAGLAAGLVSRGGKLGDHGFMILLGSLGSASFVLSLAAWLSIQKARNGAMAIAVELAEVTPRVAIILAAIMLISTGLAALITLWLGKRAAQLLPKIPYTKTCLGVIAFIILIVALRSGWIGLIVLLTSTAVGLLPAALKTARVQAMGCLLL